ncbi:hypothetical protein [Gimesia panareensis]|uniref:hypothetical protein n=1 Tax=Gimesia panareensis TaxID=2527978 RepID=UPI00118A9C70|nr:hypothetical protein [Gimesia panareensis]QDU48412.1 NADH:ubiquinone oxidoreductase subunit L [Gimesia panareensis]
MDKTITVLLQLSLIAPFVTVLMSALVASRILKGNPRWPALLGVSVSTLVALTAVIYFSPLLREQSYSQTLIRWLTLPGQPSLPLEIGVLFDPLSLTFYALLSLGMLCYLLLSPPDSNAGAGPTGPRYAVLLLLIGFCSTTGIVLATNFLQLFFCWCLLSMSLNLLHEVNFHSPDTAESPRRHWWGWNAFGDGTLLLGLFLMQTNFANLDFLTALQPAALSQVAAENRTALPGISVLLFFAALPRLGMFPASSLLISREDAWAPRSLAGINLLSILAGLFLLLRCAPLILAVPATQILLLQLGALSALLTAFSALSLQRKTHPDRSLSWLAATLASLVVAALGMGQAGITSGILALVALELLVLAVLISLACWQQNSGIPTETIGSARLCSMILILLAVCGLTGLLPALIAAHASAEGIRTELFVWLVVLVAAAYVAGLVRFTLSLTAQKSMTNADSRFPLFALWGVSLGVSAVGILLLIPLPFVPTIWPGPLLETLPPLFERDWLLCSLFGLALLVAVILTWMTAGRHSSTTTATEPPALLQLGRSHFYILTLLNRVVIQPLQLLARLVSLIEEWVVSRLSRFSLEKIPEYWGTLLLHMENGQAAFPALILVMTLSVLIFVLMVLQI